MQHGQTEIRYMDGFGGIVKAIGPRATDRYIKDPIGLDRFAKRHYPHDAMGYEIFVFWRNEGKEGLLVRAVAHNRVLERMIQDNFNSKRLLAGADRK